MADKDTGSNFAAGFILGGIIGIAIGFLYAPKPGRETREFIKEKAEKAREKVNEATEKAKEAAEETRERVEKKLRGEKPAS